MSRIRSIKPEFWTSAQVMECSVSARLLFIGLWNFCDDAGRHVDSPKRIKAEVFPGDDVTSVTIHGMITELVEAGLIIRYTFEGKDYLQVTGWHHQKINKPQPAKYPGPDEPGAIVTPGSFQEHSCTDGIRSDPIRSDPIRPTGAERSGSEGELELDADEPPDPPGLHASIVDAYHELLPDLPRVKDWNARRRRKLDARIRERLAEGKPADQVDYWRKLFAKAERSDLLCGRKTEWRADLEWLLEPRHFTKLIEGGYDNVERRTA